MQGVITHVSNYNIRTACTTTLKNIPENLGLEPYRPRILVSRAQLLLALIRFPNTTVQLLYASVKILPRHLKELTVSSSLL